MTTKLISPNNPDLLHWLLENGSDVRQVLERNWPKESYRSVSDWSSKWFPADITGQTDELRAALRATYWKRLMKNAEWSVIQRLVPYNKVITHEDLELIYSVTRITLCLPQTLQRMEWLPCHSEGMEAVIQLTPLPTSVSVTDDWSTLLKSTAEDLAVKVPPEDQIPELLDASALSPVSSPVKSSSDVVFDPKTEENKLLFEFSKHKAKKKKKSAGKNRQPINILQEIESGSSREEFVQVDPTEEEISQFNAHRDDTVDSVDTMYYVSAKQDNVYQTGPLVALSKALCGVTQQVPEEILSILRRDIPKLTDTKYTITAADLESIKKGRSGWSAKKAQLYSKWALDALDCATEIPLDMTIKHYTLMLPQDLTLRHKSDLLVRARGNLETLLWVHKIQSGGKVSEEGVEDAFSNISDGVTLSALHNAKSTIEPIAAAVLARLLSLEADTQQTVSDLTRQVDRLIASNTSTENANNNLYKTFSVWAESFHGKTEDELGGLLKGRGKSGVDTISELSRVSRSGTSVSQASFSRSNSVVSQLDDTDEPKVYKRPVSKLKFISKPK